MSGTHWPSHGDADGHSERHSGHAGRNCPDCNSDLRWVYKMMLLVFPLSVVSTPQRFQREKAHRTFSPHTVVGQLGRNSHPRHLNGGGISRWGRREGQREGISRPFRLAEPRTFTFSSRTEVGKIQQNIIEYLGNGRGSKRGAPSPVPCRNSLLEVMQIWFKWDQLT